MVSSNCDGTVVSEVMEKGTSKLSYGLLAAPLDVLLVMRLYVSREFFFVETAYHLSMADPYMNMGFGGGGGYGGRGQGTEMLVVVLCCVCCFCLASVLAGYWFNLFCGVSTSLGKSCPSPTMAPMPNTNPTPGPNTNGVTVPTCSTAYEGQYRAPNDPRPAINAQACVGYVPSDNSPGLTGRDCFYWQAQTDPKTLLQRWVRIPNSTTADAKNAACTPVVNCKMVIDFNSPDLAAYSDNNPAPLEALCTPVVPQVSTAGAITTYITAQATKSKIVHRTSTGGAVPWTPSQSTLWTNTMLTNLQGRNITPYVQNTGTAAINLAAALNQVSIEPETFAGMLEASIKPTTNSASWINDTVNLWKANIGSYPGEAGFINFMQTQGAQVLHDWPKYINNPATLAAGKPVLPNGGPVMYKPIMYTRTINLNIRQTNNYRVGPPPNVYNPNNLLHIKPVQPTQPAINRLYQPPNW